DSDRAPAAIASAKDIGHRLDRAVDLLVAVRERWEQALVLARRDVHPALEQPAEELRVAPGVELREPLDPPPPPRPQPEHGAPRAAPTGRRPPRNRGGGASGPRSPWGPPSPRSTETPAAVASGFPLGVPAW